MNAPTPAHPLQLLLVDDHSIVREGLKRILDEAGSDWVITEAGTGLQALEILRSSAIDLLVADLSMPGMNGLELIQRVRSLYPTVAILVLSMHAEEQYALRAFKAGAKGYVTKDSAADELVVAVQKVAAGSGFVSASLAARVLQQLNGAGQAPHHALLSDREMDVLQHIVAGQRLTDIAAELNLSIKTVSTHKARIQEKLGLPNMAALIRYGLEHQLDRSQGGLLPSKP